MRYFLIILWVITVVHIQSQTILLTPILPASAFQNEFYQVRFRVRNLAGARFEFRNVPQFFTASSEGLVSGVPTKQGLYPIEVIYFNQTFKQSKEVIIDVRRGTKLTNYNPSTQTQQLSTPLKPKQQYLFTYNENDQLNIEVNITNGQAPYVFEPIYIPEQMTFDNKTGAISGAFHKYGDYVLGLKVKDGKGLEMQVLIKITIVIRNTTAPKFIFYQRSLLQVKFEISKVTGNVAGTLPDNGLKNDTKTTTIQGGSVNLPTNDQSKSVIPQSSNQSQTIKPSDQNLSQSSTKTQSNSSSSSGTQTSSINNSSVPNPLTPQKSTEPVIPQSVNRQAESTSQSTEIIPASDIINKNITTDVNMEKIQKQKDRLNKKLQQSKEELKACYANVEVSRTTVQNYLSSYNEQVAKVDVLKDEIQELKTKSQKASSDLEEKLAKLKTYQIEKMLAEKEVNRSQMSFDNVNFAYNGSMTNINKNLEEIQNLQNTIDSYNRDLDNSYKTVDEALASNTKLEQEKLHVGDDIRKGMGLFSLINSTKSHSFGGCDNYKFYQKSIGVGQVKKVVDKIYLLTNNQFITFGDCTESQPAKAGDIIEWKGYLQNGAVSALKIKKIK